MLVPVGGQIKWQFVAVPSHIAVATHIRLGNLASDIAKHTSSQILIARSNVLCFIRHLRATGIFSVNNTVFAGQSKLACCKCSCLCLREVLLKSLV